MHRPELACDRRVLVGLVLCVPLFFPGWLNGQVPGPFAAGVSDTFVFFEPYALEFARALRDGHSPFWSHTSAFGAPTLLTLGTGALHPFHLLHFVVPDWLAFTLGWWLRIALFTSYLYAYLRLLDIRAWIALSFTLMLGYGSFFINYGYEIIGFVVAFFPMALFHGTRVCRAPNVRDIVGLSVAVAALILGGFPSVILYLLLTLGLYLLVTAGSHRALTFVALSFAAGVLLVLPTIVETLRFYPTTGYSAEQRKALFFYDPPALTALNFVLPSAFGNMQDYAAAGMRDFYGSLLGAGVVTIPLLACLAAYLAVRRIAFPGPALFWGMVFLVSTIAYFNVFGVKSILQFVPVINEHPLTRLQVLIVLGSTIATASLLEHTLRTMPPIHGWVLIGPTLGLLVAAYAWAVHHLPGDRVLGHARLYGAIGAAALIALGRAAATGRRGPGWFFVGSCVVLGVATSLSYTHYFSPQDYYPKNAPIAYIGTHLHPGARVLDVQNRLFKNTAIAHAIPSLTNHWFSPPALRGKVHEVSATPASAGLTLDVINAIDPARAWSILREMHVQFVALPCAENQRWMHGPLPPAAPLPWRVLPLQAGGVCLVEVLWDGRPLDRHHGLRGNGYRAYQEAAGAIRLVAESTVFTIPVRHHDGWTVVAGDADLVRTAEGWIGIHAREPQQQITLGYEPRNLGLWLIPGPIALAVVVLAQRGSAQRRRHNQAPRA